VLPDGCFQWQRIAKDARRCCREEGSAGRRGREHQVQTQAQIVLTLGLDQIIEFLTAWMGPLLRVMYSGLTQSVSRLDRVNSSSCDFPEKIPVDSDASPFM
jgi:hypothetical protein